MNPERLEEIERIHKRAVCKHAAGLVHLRPLPMCPECGATFRDDEGEYDGASPSEALALIPELLSVVERLLAPFDPPARTDVSGWTTRLPDPTPEGLRYAHELLRTLGETDPLISRVMLAARVMDHANRVRRREREELEELRERVGPGKAGAWVTDGINDAVRDLVRTLWLYPKHSLDSRGPQGLVADAIKRLRPDVSAALDTMSPADAFQKYFAEEEFWRETEEEQ